MRCRKNHSPLLIIPSYCIVLTLLFPAISLSQNLVPNSSIENANCPTTYNGFPAGVGLMIPDWYSVTCTSPDAFTNCSNNAMTQVPNNLFGTQTARTGGNYLGFGMYGGWYDYVGAKLSCKLIAGNSYSVSFWLSRCDNARYAADEIGMYLSAANTKMTCGFGNTILSYTPQIINPAGNYLNNQTGWTEIAGTYVAAGGEEYITIGYFKPWNVANFQDGGTGYSMPRSAYYIDDISVVGAGDCPLSFDEREKGGVKLSSPSSNLEVFYNAEKNRIHIPSSENLHTISIWNMNGQRMAFGNTGENEFQLPEIPQGIYLLILETDQQIFSTRLFVGKN